MKLQVNSKGSWRDVLSFSAAQAPEVEDAAASLARASGQPRMRIVDHEGRNPRWLNDRGVFRPLNEKDA